MSEEVEKKSLYHRADPNSQLIAMKIVGNTDAKMFEADQLIDLNKTMKSIDETLKGIDGKLQLLCTSFSANQRERSTSAYEDCKKEAKMKRNIPYYPPRCSCGKNMKQELGYETCWYCDCGNRIVVPKYKEMEE